VTGAKICVDRELGTARKKRYAAELRVGYGDTLPNPDYGHFPITVTLYSIQIQRFSRREISDAASAARQRIDNFCRRQLVAEKQKTS
jgi:hypothetical protein